MTRAVAMAVLAASLISGAVTFAVQNVVDSNPKAAKRLDAVDARLARIEAELDRLATAVATRPARSPEEMRDADDLLCANEADCLLATARDTPDDAPALRIAKKELAQDEPGRGIDWQDLRAQSMRDLDERRVEPDARFGEHGLRVGSLAADLDLSETQQAAYHELLRDFEQRAADLYEANGLGVSGDSSRLGERMTALEDQRRQLDSELDEAFGQFLDREQLESYRALPEHRRGLAPGAGVDALAARGIGRLWAER